MLNKRVFSGLLLIVALVFAMGLTGCGGGGGSSIGGIGGGGANHPIVGGTVQAYIGGAWTNVSTTTTNGQVVSFSSSKLSGATYPLVFRIQPGTGYVQGYSSTIKYAGELKTVYASQPTNVYFSLLSTMVANLYDSVRTSYPTDAAALSYAIGRVKSVISAFGVAGFDPTTTNPYTSFNSAMVQAALWKGYGLTFTDPSDSSSIDNMVLGFTNQLKNSGTSPATAVQSALPLVAAQITAAGSAATGLANFMNTVKADTDIASGIATSYASSSFGTTQAAVQTTLTSTATDPATQMADSVGEFYISAYAGTVGAGAIRNNSNYTILTTEAGNTLTYTVTIKDANGANMTDAITATLSNSNIGTMDATSKVPAGGAATFTLTLANPLPAGESFTVTFSVTKSGTTSEAVTTGLTQSSGANIAASITTPTAQVGGANKRLLHMTSGNSYLDSSTYALSATVGALDGGAFSSDTINVNFIAPTGVKFKISGSSYDNYMVTATTAGVATQNVQFLGTSSVNNGLLGSLTAEVYYKRTGAKVSPTISKAASGDFYAYTGTAVSDIRRLVLTAGGSNTVNASAIPDGGTVNLSSSGNQLSLQFVTWDGDTDIDTVEEAADNSAAVNTLLATRNMKIYSDAPTGGGFQTDTGYDNIGLGIASGSTSDGQGNTVMPFTAARFTGITDDTPFSGYKHVVGSTTDNLDNITVRLFNTTAYTGTYNLSTTTVIRYQ
ncbi:MAG: hypothetical protein V3571_11450 [Pseudodesulfovibrio sp.]